MNSRISGLATSTGALRWANNTNPSETGGREKVYGYDVFLNASWSDETYQDNANVHPNSLSTILLIHY